MGLVPQVRAQSVATPPPTTTTQAPAGDQSAAVRVELDRLRKEFQALREQYDQRFTALEARLATLEAGKGALAAGAAPQPAAPAQPQGTVPAQTPPAGGAPAAPVAAAPAPPGAQQAPVGAGAAGAGGPEGTLPVYGNTSALSKVFNPDIAVIGDFIGAAGRNRIETSPAFELHEGEVSYQAVVDPYARADFFFSFSETGVNIEEGYLTFTSLPGGLLMRAGKMRGAFGKVDQMHTHVLPWVDRPLVIRSLAGGEDGIDDAGVSVSRLIPNKWMFLEATGQVFRGTSSLFNASSRGDLTYLGHLRAYQDITESSNIDLGGSVAYGHNDVGPDQTTRVYGIDATFRYRPLRRAIYRQFIGRTELVWSHRDQLAGTTKSFGFYVSGDYQFARRWFGGARYDWSDRPDNQFLNDRGTALLLTYWPSEFSQIRGEWRRTRYAEGNVANELLFQFLFSIGAHGAHPF
jgi:hypothetical protein